MTRDQIDELIARANPKPSEDSFDELLKEAVADEVIEPVYGLQPWSVAFRRICVGLGLQLFTLNFFSLNYFLPMIGQILLVLGFRTVKTENGWLKGGYVTSVIKLVFMLFYGAVASTVYFSDVFASGFGFAFGYIQALLSIIVLIQLRGAIVTIQRKNGMDEPHTGGLMVLIVFEVIALLGQNIQINSLIFAILLLIILALSLRSLVRIYHEMEDLGYDVKASAVKISDGALSKALAIGLVVVIACGYTFFGKVNMNWQKVESTKDAGVTQAREHLLELGYPREELADLADEDVLKLKDAIAISVHEHSFAKTSIVPGLKMTDVFVKLDEKSLWASMHHYNWRISEEKVRGVDSFVIWPETNTYGHVPHERVYFGRALYDKNGVAYASNFYSLGETNAAQAYRDDVLGYGPDGITHLGSQYYETFAVSAVFSYPRNAEYMRGYVGYEFLANYVDAPYYSDYDKVGEGETKVATFLVRDDYFHQISKIQFPVMWGNYDNSYRGPYSLGQAQVMMDVVNDKMNITSFWSNGENVSSAEYDYY